MKDTLIKLTEDFEEIHDLQTQSAELIRMIVDLAYTIGQQDRLDGINRLPFGGDGKQDDQTFL